MIAVLIFAHKNLPQTRRLINSLKNKNIDIFMHVDKKYDFDESEFLDNNLLKRHDIKWGSYKQAGVVFESLKTIMNTKKYTHFIYMSGQDYLLCPVNEIISFLSANTNKSFMTYSKIDTVNVENRYLEYHTNLKYIDAILRRIMPPRKIFKGMDTYCGSSWWILSFNAACYMVQEYYKKYYQKLRFTKCIDEVIYQTILLNSSFADSIINDNKWYISWDEHIKGLNKGNPDILKKKDFKKLIKSDKFFARKFDAIVDKKY